MKKLSKSSGRIWGLILSFIVLITICSLFSAIQVFAQNNVPDLIVNSVTIDRNGHYTIVIKNIGTGKANMGAISIMRYYKDINDSPNGSMRTNLPNGFDSSLNYTDKSYLNPGQSYVVPEVNGNIIPQDTASMLVSVNDLHDVYESNYDNNYKSAESPIQAPLPDLIIQSLTVDQNGNYDVVVKNIGTGIADMLLNDLEVEILSEYSAVDGHKSSDRINLRNIIYPGQSYTVHGKVPLNTSILKVTVNDGLTRLKESNYSNNSKTIDVAHSDLIISSLKQQGSTVTVSVKNIGELAYQGLFYISSYLNDEGESNAHSTETTSITVAAGDEITKTIHVDKPTFSTVLHVDIKVLPVDGDYQNNSADLTLTGEVKVEELVNDDPFGVKEFANLENKPGDDAQVDPEKAAGILPDSPLYGFKELGRGIADAFTFDQEQKAELGAKIANEKALEISVMIDKGASDDKVTNAATDAFKTDDKLAKALDEVRKKDSVKADDLTSKVVGDRLKRETVLEKLKHKITVDDGLQVSQTEDTSLDGLGVLVGKMKDPNKLKDAVEKSTSGKGSPFKPLKDLVALNAVSSHITNENAREILEHAKEREQDHLKNNLQNLTPKQLSLFNDYVDKTTGDKVNTLKALDDTKGVVTDKNVRGVLGTAKNKTISNLVNDIQEAKKKDPNAASTILGSLQKGSISDLRVLTDLKSKDSSVNGDIISVKKTAISNFEKNVNALKPDQKQKYLTSITQDHLDLTQQSVVNDLKQTLPNSDISKKMDSTLKSQVKTKVARVKNNKKQYDEFLTSISSDTTDDKTTINDFTTGFDTSFYKDIMRQQLSYMKSYYDSADPETKKIFDQYYFNDPQIKAFYSDFDGTFDQLFNGTNTNAESLDNSSQEAPDLQDQSSDASSDDSSSDVQTTSGCPMTDDPVCGKDGLNYPNECEAKDNGTEVDYKGECKDTSTVQQDEQQSTQDNQDNSDSQSDGGDDSSVQGASTYRGADSPWNYYLPIISILLRIF